MYTQFYYIKVGFKGVKIITACFRDVKRILHSIQASLATVQYLTKCPDTLLQKLTSKIMLKTNFLRLHASNTSGIFQDLLRFSDARFFFCVCFL